jgi:NAD(P)-dependent dehydrogenase (short-subunit alcohol dehydrogenase family)
MLVFAGCLTQQAVEAFRLEQAQSDRFHPLRLDVTSEASLAEAMAEIRAQLSKHGVRGLWAVVTNAGIRQASVPDDWITDIGPFQRVFDVNLLGTIRTVQAAKPLLRAHPGGARIVIIESMYGVGAAAYQSAG